MEPHLSVPTVHSAEIALISNEVSASVYVPKSRMFVFEADFIGSVYICTKAIDIVVSCKPLLNLRNKLLYPSQDKYWFASLLYLQCAQTRRNFTSFSGYANPDFRGGFRVGKVSTTWPFSPFTTKRSLPQPAVCIVQYGLHTAERPRQSPLVQVQWSRPFASLEICIETILYECGYQVLSHVDGVSSASCVRSHGVANIKCAVLML